MHMLFGLVIFDLKGVCIVEIDDQYWTLLMCLANAPFIISKYDSFLD